MPMSTPLPPVSTLPLPGRYRHYKGQEYLVLGVARHSENPASELVVYRALYGDGGLWVRPQAMFTETVTLPTGPVPRFTYVGPV